MDGARTSAAPMPIQAMAAKARSPRAMGGQASAARAMATAGNAASPTSESIGPPGW